MGKGGGEEEEEGEEETKGSRKVCNHYGA